MKVPLILDTTLARFVYFSFVSLQFHSLLPTYLFITKSVNFQ